MLVFLFSVMVVSSQNKVEKELFSKGIETIVIDGNQVFKISVVTSNSDKIVIHSVLDGEYQDQFQIVTKQHNDSLKLSLKRLPFTTKTDDKRNAHKVVAATLKLELPESLELNIISDIGSVDLRGRFNSMYIQLKQGHCTVDGTVKKATINTFDGYIRVTTVNAKVNAFSNNGNVSIDTFAATNSLWELQSINGDITVVKKQ